MVVEKVLVCIGRRPNFDRLDLDKAGIRLNERGVPDYNRHTMQIEDKPVFIAGDVNGDRPLLHEAADEGRIAGINAVADKPLAFRRKTPLYITFSDPNIVLVGQRYSELDLDKTLIGGVFALAITGEYLSVPASVGFIALFGIAVQNGMVLVTYFNDLRGRGRPVAAAVMEGLAAGDHFPSMNGQTVVNRFHLSTEKGYSEFWRRNKSPIATYEMARLLGGLRKVASYVGRNSGKIIWSGMDAEGAIASGRADLVAFGVAVGGLVAFLLARSLGDVLFETESFDPAAYALVAAVMLAVGLLASLVPALRAAAIDPAVALRDE